MDKVRVSMGPRFIEFMKLWYPDLWEDLVSQGCLSWLWVTVGTCRCGFYWPTYNARCLVADRAADGTGDGIVLDIVPNTPLELVMAYFDLVAGKQDVATKA
jgi:hypothetical protein